MYRCDECDYETTKKYNLNKHLLTKKHKRNITRINADTNTEIGGKNAEIGKKQSTKEHNESTKEHKKSTKEHKKSTKEHKFLKKTKNRAKYKCDDCDKLFSSKAILKRHSKNYCKKKILLKKKQEHINQEFERLLKEKEKEINDIRESNEKEVNDIRESKEKEVNDILESREKYKKEVIDLKNMVYNNQREFIEYAKEQNKPKNVSNVFYIQNNYKNAQTMDQLLKDWKITYPQWVRAALKGYVAGCTELIEDQFINNHSFMERPMHCLDPSRGIFMFNDSEMGWMKNGQVDINSVITNVDTKFNEFNRDYQEDVPVDNEIRNIKEKAKEDDPLIFYNTIDKFNSFIPAKYKNEEDKDSEYEKSKKKIIKNLSVKCAFNKPVNENIVIENITDLTINC